jgi:hypothetical protein
VTDFAACFDTFRSTAFRLETLQHYDAPAEYERIAAFREGMPLPERSPRTSPWLRRVAETTAEGKRWSRVRVVDRPLSEYVRFELVTYVESQRAGEDIHVTDRQEHPALEALRTDFWLFDVETSQPFAALMEYDQQGRYLGAEVTSAPEAVRACTATRDLALRHSAPLATYLARLGRRETHAA